MSGAIEREPGSLISNDAIEEQAAAWLAARDGENWLDADQVALQRWLSQSTRHRVCFLRLEACWQRMDRLQVDRNRERIVSRFPSRAGGPVPATSKFLRLPSASIGRLAACLALVAALAGTAHMAMTDDEVQLHTTATGERAVITLADGTRVTMNTSTRLRTSITATRRHLWLEGGEAFFEVAHDASRPFVVDAGDQQVKVLGTKFTLRLEKRELRAHVVEGRVQVSSASGARALLLAKDSVDATDAALSVHHSSQDEQESALSWLQGKIFLDGMTLSQAATEFNRYNGRKLLIKDSAARSMVIGGVFDTNNVDGFSRLLERGFGLEVEFRPNVVVVGSKPKPAQVAQNAGPARSR